MFNESCENPRQGEYYDYLNQHIGNVQRSYYQFLRDYIQRIYSQDVEACDITIAGHDASKYNDDEFLPYCNYFYPCSGFEKDEKAFDLAWLAHQHRNPHHWQHWVLMRDSGEKTPVDMPIEEIVNMVCDWHSFSAKDPKSTADKWYKDNKSKMLLSDYTRKKVEEFLKYLTKPVVVR